MKQDADIKEEQLKISCIVLAAGDSRRIGTNKMLLPFGKSNIIQSVIDAYDHSAIKEKVVVVGSQARNIIEQNIALSVKWIVNPNPEKEVGSSLQMGLNHISAHSDAVIIAHGDMPLVRKETISGLISRYQAGSIVIPVFQKRKGHPVLMDRTIALKCLDPGLTHPLRQVIRVFENQIFMYECDDEGVLLDIDTAEDYNALVKKINSQ